MSAGTGVYHSEYNKNEDKEVKFLQIWVFPNKKNVEPRYDQISIRDIEQEDEFYQVLSPNPNDQGVWVHQNAWFHLGNFKTAKNIDYTMKDPNNGLYVFVLKGSATVEGQELATRDGFGIWDTDTVNFNTTPDSRLLLMEVPMSV
jgi:redox-sensitive bicupin YhaK (pirin superfamily)